MNIKVVPTLPHSFPMINRSSHRFLSRASLMVAAALLGTAPAAKAATLTWDGADLVSADAQGGTGTWNTNTSANWWDGAGNVVWPALGGTDDDAVFGGTAGTITIAAGGVTANDLTFNTTGYVLGGGVLTLNGATPTITVGNGLSTSITARISGASGLTKSGNGTLTLSGANDYTGVTAITAGTLRAGSGTALGGLTGGTTVASGATLDVGGQNLTTEAITIAGSGVGSLGAIINTGAEQANALGRLALSANATIGGSTRWDLRNSAPTLDMGGFTLTKTGSNYIALVAVTGGNPGNVVVNQGELSLSTSTAIAGSSTNSITVNNGGILSMYQSSNAHLWTLNLNSGGTLRGENGNRSQNIWAGPVNAAGNVTILAESTHNLMVTGALTGTANIVKSGAGNAIITGSYALAGDVTVSAGTLQLGAGGTGGSLSSNTLSLAAGTNLIFNQSSDRIQGVDFGAISGAGNFSQNGAGNVTFGTSTAQTYSGGTSVNRGTFTLDFANLATPTNMVNASSALTLGGGRLNVLGKNTGTSVQTFASTALSAGSVVSMNRGSGTSTTLNLGTITRSAGGTVSFQPTTAWAGGTSPTAAGTASTTEIVRISGVTNINGPVTMPAAGTFGYIGAGFFNNTGNATRYLVAQGAATPGPYQLIGGPQGTGFVTTGGVATTVYTISANQTLTGNTTNYATLATAAATLANAGFSYTTNGVLNIGTGLVTISGTGSLIIGAERDFVANMANTGGLTISSVVANNTGGASNFTVSSSGSGVVTLSANNTYTGITTINSGTLSIATDLNLGAAPGAAVQNGITLNGGTLSITPTATTTIASNRGMMLGAGGGTLANTAAFTVTYGGVITGPGALTLNIASGGGLTIGAASTFTGGATLSGSGTVFVTNSSAFGVGGTLRLNGAQLRPSTGGDATIANPLSIAANTTFPSVADEKFFNFTGPAEISGGSRTLTVNIGSNVAGKSVTLSGPLTESVAGSSLTKAGTGELIISGVSAYTGVTAVTAGRLRLGKNYSLYNNNAASWTDTNIVVSPNATLALRVGGFSEFTAANVASLSGLGTATGGFLAGSFIGLDTSSGNFTYANSIANTNAGANSLGLVKLGANSLTLSAANSYTGLTFIGGGTLVAANPEAFGPAGNDVYFTANTNAATAAGGQSGNGNLEFATDSSVNAYDLFGSSQFASTLTLSRATAGVATIHTLGRLVWGNNTLTISAGTNNSSGTPGVIFADGMSLTAGNAGNSTLIPTTATIVINGPVNIPLNDFAKTLVLDGLTTGNTISGDISNGVVGSIALTKSNNSTWTISGNNSYTGATTVNAGTLIVSGINTGPGATNIIGGTLQAGADGVLNPNSAVTMTNAAAAVLDLNGKLGTIGSLAGGGATGGNVTLGTGSLTTGANGTSTAYAGNITGSGNLIKAGIGVFTFSSAQSYTGTTSVSNGTLLVNSTLASSATTIASGATLGGTGTLTNLATVNAGGVLSPATTTTPGTLTIGSLTLDAGARLTFELSATQAASDLIAVTTPSGLTINGGAISLFAAGGTAPLTLNGTYTIFTYAGSLGGSKDNLSVFNSEADKTYSITDNGSALLLTIGTATTSNWSGTSGDGLWTSDGAGGNWSGLATPNSLGSVVNFGNLATLATTVTLNGGKTVGSIIFNNANSFTVGTTADVITLDNGIAAAAISANNGAHTINAPITLNGPANITPAASTSLTFGGAISGAGKALTLSGAGAVTLLATNTHGSTILNAGTLNIGNDGALGSGALTISGGTLTAIGGARALSANNSVSITGDFAFTGTNDLNLGVGSVNIIGARTITAGASTLSIGGIISGSGLTKAGGGTLVLSGLNTYSGPTTINAGTLVVDVLANGGAPSGIGQSPGAAANLVLGGGTLKYTGTTSATNRSFTLSAATTSVIEVTGNAAILTLAGAAATSGSLTKTGAGALVISGANAYTGATTVNAGQLIAQGSHASSSNTIAAGSVLELNSAVTRDYPTTSFNGAGTLRKTGAGEIIWGSSAATFAIASGGLIDVQGGIFKGGSNGNEVWTNNLSDLNVAAGARFDGVEANVRVNRITGTGRLLTGFNGANYANLTIGVDNGSSTFDGTIENSSSTGNIVKTGSGSINLTGANSYTGTTIISAGTLTLSGNRTVNMGGAVTVGNLAATAATLNVQGNLPMAAQTMSVGSATGATGTVNQTGGVLSFTSGNALLIGTSASGATGVYNLSAGTISTFSSNNRGVMIGVNNGAAGNPIAATFNLSGTGSLNNATGTLQVVRGDDASSFHNSTYNQTGGTSSNGFLTIGGNGVNGANSLATFTVTGGTFSAAAFSFLSAGNNVTSALTIGGTADVTLPAFPTARGTGSTATLTFDGGTLKPAASSPAYLGGLTNAFIQDGGARFDTNNFDIAVSQNLLADPASLGGGLTKTGNGTLTLSGANTFTGGVTISGGTLLVGSAGALNATTGFENAVAFGSSTTGTLALNGRSITVSSLSGNAAGPTVTNATGATAANAVLTVGNSTNASGSYAGSLQDGTGGGTLGLTKAGNGTLTLSGANTYSGATTISAGTLAAGASNALSASSDLILADLAGATVSLGGFSQTVKSLTGGGANGGNISLGADGGLTVTGTGSFGGVISGTGTSGMTKTGNGTQTLTGVNTYAGATSVTGGTLALSGSGSINDTSALTINGATAALAHRGSIDLMRPVSLVQGSVSGTGTINTLTVSGSTSNTIAPGFAGSGTLTIRSLDFLGQARIDFSSNGGAPTNFLSIGSLSTAGAGGIVLNVLGVPQGGWSSGTYDLLEYSSATGAGVSGFVKGDIMGATNRTTTSLKTDVVGKVSLVISNNIVRWTGTVDGEWSVAAPGNWELFPALTATNYQQGDALLFDDNATGTTTVIATEAADFVRPSSVTFDNSAKDYRLEGDGFIDPSLQLSVGLTKNGTGKLTISATNLYSGTTLINAGNITMAGLGSLGENAPLTLAGGQLDLGGTLQQVGAVTINNASATGATILGAGSLTGTSYLVNNATGDAVISSVLSGNGVAFTKNGLGRVTLAGTTAYTGATTVNAGTLALATTGTLGATSALNIQGGSVVLSAATNLHSAIPLNMGGGFLDLGGTAQAVGAVSVTSAASSGATITNGSLTGASYAVSNATGDAVINAALLANGAIGFTKTGNGRVTLGGANTYTGATTVSAGTLAAGSSSAFTGLNSLAISGRATLDLNGVNATFSGDVTTAPATVTITDTAAGTGTSTITFRQTSGVALTTPTLIVDGPSRKVAFAFANGNGDQRFSNANNTFSGGLTILGSTTGGRMTIGTAPANTFVSGVLTASPYGTGPITIGQAATDLAGIYVVAANATLANPIVANTTRGTDRAGTFRIDATGLTLSGQVTAGASDLALSTNGTGTVSLTGRITGTNGLRLLSHNLGGASLTVTLANTAGTNDYSGNTTINDNAQVGRSYTLVLGASDQIPNGAGKGNVVINTNGTGAGTLRLQGFSDTINGLSGNGNVTTTVAGASILTLGDGDATASFGGTITESVGTVGLAKIGAGTQTLTTSLAHTGGTTVTAGTLVLGHATDTLSDTGTVTVNGGTLSLGANNETVGSLILSSGTLSSSTGTLTSATNFDLRGGTVAAILGGAVGLNKTTAGTTEVTSVNAFTGATSVTNGVLRLSGAGDINSTSGISINGAGAKFVQASSVAVSKAVTLTQGTLTGSGAVNTVDVGAGTGGVISNNDGIGGAALTIGTLTLSGGANLNLFSDGTALIPLTITSLVNNASAGAVTITANNPAGWTNGTTYDLLSYGSLSGTGASSFTYVANNKSARQTESWSIVNSTVKLTIDGTKPYWTGTTDNKWNTSTAGNWKLLADNTDTLFLPSDDVLFNDNAGGAGTVTVDIDQANVATSLTLFENATRDYVLAGAFGISAGSLTKAGNGTLTIGTVNTYAGATSINGGRVVLTGSGTLGSGSALTMAGGSLDLGNGTRTVGAVSVTAPASAGDTIGNGSLTGSSYAASNATGTAVISANLLANGSAGFVKSGAGAVTLSGANTFTGGLTLNAGTVNISSSGALGAGSVILVGGSLDNITGQAATFTNALTFNGDFAFIGTADLTFSGATTLGSAAGSTRIVTVNGSSLTLGAVANGTTGNSLTKAGAGSIVLSGTNTYTGVTTVQNGSLRLTGSLPAASSMVLGNTGNSGKFILGGAAGAVNQTLASLTTSGTGTANAVVGGASTLSTLTLGTGTTAVTYGGLLGGAGTNENNLGLAKTGASALTLSGTSTYDGVTTVTAGGAIIVTADGALGSAVGNTILTGVAAGNAGLIGLSGGVNYATAERIIAVGAGNTAALTGLAALQRGVVQSVSGNNTFAGTIEVSATGMTRIGVQDGAQLNLTGPIVRSTGVTGVTILFRAGTNDGDFITLSSNANDWDMDTQIYSSNAGTGSGVRLGISNALPTAYSVVGATSTFAGTLLDLAGFDQTLNGLTSSGNTLRIGNTSATPSTLTLNNLSDKASGAGTAIIDGAGAGKVAVVKTGAFYQALQSVNTYTGGTWIKEGDILLWSGNDRLAPTGTVTLGDVSTTGRLVIGETGTARTQTLAGLTTTGLGGSVVAASGTNSTLTLNIASGTNTFSGTLGGSTGANDNNLNLIKTGAGILELTNANTYVGSTTISGGTLALARVDALSLSSTILISSTVGAGTLRLATDSSVNAYNIGSSSSNPGTIVSDRATAGAGLTHALGLIQLGANIYTFESGANVTSGTAAISFSSADLSAGNGNAVTLNPTSANVIIVGGVSIATNNQAKPLTLGGTSSGNLIQGVIANGLNTLTITKAGTSTWTLTGANTYTGITTVNNGILRVTSLGTTGASSVGASDRANAANLRLNGAVRLEYAGAGEATSRSFTVSGTGMTLASSGSGALAVTSATQVAFATDGASARELKLAGTNTGDNTYAATAAGTPAAADVFQKITKNEVGKWVIAGSGTTFADNLQVEVNAGLLAFGQASQLRSGAAVVNGGTLSVSSGANTNASVTVNNGGSLAGSASLGAVTVNNGGALSPGNSPGIFTSTTLSLAGGAIINWQVMDALGVAGTGYDRLVTGQLDLT